MAKNHPNSYMDVSHCKFLFPINQSVLKKLIKEVVKHKKLFKTNVKQSNVPFHQSELLLWNFGQIQIVHCIYWASLEKVTCWRNQNKRSGWTSPLGETLFFRTTWKKDKNFCLLPKVRQSLQKTIWRLPYFLAIYESRLKGLKDIQNYEDRSN